MNLLGNLPPVVKNLLLLNVAMYIITAFMKMQGMYLGGILGGYVFNSPLFEPYQIVSHFFMHGGGFHIFFNMFALLMFGPILERVWGPKRFFIFYVITALGAFFLHQFVGYLEVKQMKDELIAQGIMSELDFYTLNDEILKLGKGSGRVLVVNNTLLQNYIYGISVPVVGASGAIFGILVAFAMLFPNTRLMLLFPPIPIRAKYLVLIMIALELYQTYVDKPGDNVAHLAHIGGALFGFIMVLIWKKSTRNFY